MRLCVLGLFAACVLLGAGCGLVSFDVSQDIPEQTIAASPLPNLPLPASLFQIPLMIDVNAATQGHGTGPARSANLKSLTFTVTAPADASGNFDFLDSIIISVSGTNLPDQEIARLSSVPLAQKTISIPPTPGVDLLPYIQVNANINAAASGHAPAQSTTFSGLVVVTIHV
jgi:hypothetical protein